MSPNPPADMCLNILGLDSYGTGIWTVNDHEENQKFLTNSKSIHMCLLLSKCIRKGTFDICHDPIPAIYFPLTCIFNNSCVSFDIPYRMVWLLTDHVASKVVIEGELAKFEHLFSDDDEYAKKIRGSIEDVNNTKTSGKIQGELAGQAGPQAFQAGQRVQAKKQKTQAEPSIKGFNMAFVHPVKPKLKGWKKMSMVKKATYVDKEQASELGDEEIAKGDSASAEADWF
ncbi:hypothetical protein F5146DRAFT_1006770 [Armillaria mellea]|nr:hypothetical protein F5146DRAFT_1006770 [Armillaria mellea]